jgi:16S rRNA (cytidine1402-2'-O)-methyltransferase
MKKTEKLIEELKSGKNIALVSDAGTPGISDPGHELIEACIEYGIGITGIPGASAIIDALVLSGLSTLRFSFEGFPPRHPRDRKAFFKGLSSEMRTMIFYESPHRILASLKDMLVSLGDRRIAVVREATKMFEDVKRGNISQIIEHFTKITPRGEFVIVLEGSETVTNPESEEAPDIETILIEYIKSGMTERDAVKRVSSERQLPRREVYQCMLKIKGETNEPD